jgi:hypothetical protein
LKAKTVACAVRAGQASVCGTIARADEEPSPNVPTENPPPYFPQNPLSPGDEKTARKMRLTVYGCALLAALTVIAAIVGGVYLVRSLF